jgi:hypothetical protein
MPTGQCGTRIEDVASTHCQDNGDTQSVAGHALGRHSSRALFVDG